MQELILYLSFALCTVVTLDFLSHSYHGKLSAIPTIGPSGIFSSYFGGFKFIFKAREMIQEGYEKYPQTAFKVPTLAQWIVVVNGPKLIDDIRRANDKAMSFRIAVAETFQTDHMIGKPIRKDPYHVSIVRTPLTRNLGARFEDITDEIQAAFSEIIPVTENDWTSVHTLRTMARIVARTSNRLFVGLPLCRNPDYRSIMEKFTQNIVIGSLIINAFPSFLKPFIGRFFTSVPRNIRRVMAHLRPTIEWRLEQEEKYGTDWPGKPNDLISWLLDDAVGHQRTVHDITVRVLSINFAAIHTTSMTFTHILFDVASHPALVQPMREEVAEVIAQHGWSKASIMKMAKLDSFIKESQRLGGLSALIMNRKILENYTFSDGTFVPAGTTVGVPVWSIHHDEKIYPNATEFDGFRFVNMRDAEGDGFKNQAVSLGLDFIAFGNGKHACPGRFFAINELKAMLAYVLMNYDVKLPGEGQRPANLWLGAGASPHRTASVMFRKRSKI